MTFGPRNSCVEIIRAPMGGLWAVPLNHEGGTALELFFEEPAVPLAPLGNVCGYIVEPFQSVELAEYLVEFGHTWKVA